jgi:hypothetical protein
MLQPYGAVRPLLFNGLELMKLAGDQPRRRHGAADRSGALAAQPTP